MRGLDLRGRIVHLQERGGKLVCHDVQDIGLLGCREKWRRIRRKARDRFLSRGQRNRVQIGCHGGFSSAESLRSCSYRGIALFYPVSALDGRGVVGKGKGKFLVRRRQDGSETRKQEEEKTVDGRSTKGMWGNYQANAGGEEAAVHEVLITVTITTSLS